MRVSKTEVSAPLSGPKPFAQLAEAMKMAYERADARMLLALIDGVLHSSYHKYLVKIFPSVYRYERGKIIETFDFGA
jgi:hypothetical protein